MMKMYVKVSWGQGVKRKIKILGLLRMRISKIGNKFDMVAEQKQLRVK